MATAENKAVVISFVEEVINEGRLDRVKDLVAIDFVELESFSWPATRVAHCISRHSLRD
jgi:hypothetical protein